MAAGIREQHPIADQLATVQHLTGYPRGSAKSPDRGGWCIRDHTIRLSSHVGHRPHVMNGSFMSSGDRVSAKSRRAPLPLRQGRE